MALEKIVDKTIELVFNKSSIVGIGIVIVVILHFLGFDLTQLGLNPLTLLIICILELVIATMNYGAIELMRSELLQFRKSNVNHQSFKTIIDSVSMISERLKDISELTVDTNNVVKSIPSKKIIVMKLDSITLFLVIDVLKVLINYIFASNDTATKAALERQKRKLEKEYNEIKNSYLIDIFEIASGCLEVSSEEKIGKLLDEVLVKIYDISISQTMSIEDKVSEIIDFVDDLKRDLKPLYEENLSLKYVIVDDEK